MKDAESASFAEFLQEMSHGAVDQQATDKFREIVRACMETGQSGSITVKLTIKAASKLAEVSAKISTTKPEPKVPGQTFYTSDDGNLHNEDPRQLKLPSKVIEVPAQPPRIVGKEG